MNNEKTLIYLLWFWIMIRTIISPQKNIISLGLLTSYIAVFSFIRAIISPIIIKLFLISFIVLTIFSCMLFWVGYNQLNIPFVIPNKTVYGVYLASFLPFVVSVLLYGKSLRLPLQFRALLYTALVAAAVLLVLSDSRSAWASCIGVLLFVYVNNKKRSPVIWVGIIVFLTIIAIAFFYYKHNSSEGRLLIYKISFQIFKDHWLCGTGPDHFRAVYNTYQGNYFQLHDINSHEAYLANEATYVFNDYLQFAIEKGTIGLMLISIPFILFITRIRRACIWEKYMGVVTGSIASIVIILISAFTSYPFEIVPIVINLIFYLALIDSYIDYQSRSIHKKSILKIAFGSISFVMGAYSIFLVANEVKAHKAFELSREGYKNKAMNLYQSLSYSQTNDREALYNYALALSNSNRLDEALQISEQAKKIYATPRWYSLAASLYQEKQLFKNAEGNYSMAVYITPNRIINRMQLANFYLQANQKSKATYWLDQILKMPIKVPSGTTDLYLKKAKELRNSLNL
jgi:O-antigen ligase